MGPQYIQALFPGCGAHHGLRVLKGKRPVVRIRLFSFGYLSPHLQPQELPRVVDGHAGVLVLSRSCARPRVTHPERLADWRYHIRHRLRSPSGYAYRPA